MNDLFACTCPRNADLHGHREDCPQYSPAKDPRNAARAQRDAGIQAAVNHADAVDPGWPERAYRHFVAYARAHGQFLTEAARNAAECAGLAPPPDKRAWGGVASRAARAGVVVRTGYAPASDPKVHCSIATVWRSKVYQGGA